VAISALVAPGFRLEQGIEPYAGQSVTLTQQLAAATAAVAAAQRNNVPVCFAGLSGVGVLQLFVRMDGVPAGAVDMALQNAHSSFVYPHASALFQVRVSVQVSMCVSVLTEDGQSGTLPGGTYYTATSANGMPQQQVFVQGGLPLNTNQAPIAVVGSVGVSSGFRRASVDAAVATEAVAAFNVAYLAANPLFNPSQGAIGFGIAFAVMCGVALSLLIAVMRLRARLNATSAGGISGYQQYKQPLTNT
jgi:uncharacterized protein GlcG (DUF336 family)